MPTSAHNLFASRPIFPKSRRAPAPRADPLTESHLDSLAPAPPSFSTPPTLHKAPSPQPLPQARPTLSDPNPASPPPPDPPDPGQFAQPPPSDPPPQRPPPLPAWPQEPPLRLCAVPWVDSLQSAEPSAVTSAGEQTPLRRAVGWIAPPFYRSSG